MIELDDKDDDRGYEDAKKSIPDITREEYRAIDWLAREYVRWMRSMSREERSELLSLKTKNLNPKMGMDRRKH